MSLAIALNNALTGLNINQQALSVLSQNIANANTAGYSRKVLNQSAAFIDNIGMGVKVQDVTRKIDAYLRDAVQEQTSFSGRNEVVQSFTDRMQVFLGKPGGGTSIASSIQSFFDNLQSLAETPEIGSFRLNAVNSGVALAQQMSDLASGLENLRYEADRQIKISVDQVNHDLQDLFSTNTAIITSGRLGRSPAELLDKRDNLVADLAQQLNITVNYNADDTISVATSGGITLIDSHLYELTYEAAPNVDSLVHDGTLSALRVYALSSTGVRTNSYQELVNAAPSAQTVSRITNGTIKGLLDLRDSILPGILQQLDTLAAGLRDSMNELHNSGSGFPPATQLIGTRAVSGPDIMQWSGTARIAVLDANGKPAPSGYSDDSQGKPPLDLDLSFLNSGAGNGNPSVQTIINEINGYYGVPQKRVEVGNLHNIQLVSDTSFIPNNNRELALDFDLQNLSSSAAGFFVTDMQVQDDQGVTMDDPTDTLPSIDLNDTDTFTTTAGTGVITVRADGHGLKEGSRIYLPGVGGNVNGINAAVISGYFTITNVTTDSFDITVDQLATSSGSVDDPNLVVKPPYYTVGAGGQERTRDSGLITADLSDNHNSNYYTITATVGVDDGTDVTSATISYRVYNNSTNLLNRRYSAESASGGTLINPATSRTFLRASLVDVNGVEIAQTSGGLYASDQPGFLKLEALNGYRIVIDDLDSNQEGVVVAEDVGTASNRGFSHFFELNNFFNSNAPVAGGDTLKNSALNLSVAQRIRDNPSLISMGALTQSVTPAGSSETLYTYERNVGDNSVIQQMSKLGVLTQNFDAAGGLGAATQSFVGYAGQVLGFAATLTARAQSDLDNTNSTLEGFRQRADAVSGVNLDEELANTVIYQNAYTASARVITVTSTLFDALLEISR